MAHLRNNKKFAGGFISFSWWASAGTGGIVFIVMYWVLPTLFSRNQIFSDLGRTSRSFAWLPLLLFGTLALVAIARSVIVGESRRSSRDRRQVRKTWRDTSVNISRLMVNHGWAVTRQRPMPVPKPKTVAFNKWTLDALRALDWKRFESLCVEYYEITGFQSEIIRSGADGTIDLKLYKADPAKPLAIVQCKTGLVYSVGVKDLRELLSTMSREKSGRGVFITTGSFNRDALNFAGDHQIQLLDGEGFIRKIQGLSEEDQGRLLHDAFQHEGMPPSR
jgi:restriction system protein